MDCERRVAVVTGASRGIGRAVALRLAAAGSDVVVNYCHSEQQAAEVCRAIEAMQRNAIAVRADVSVCREATQLIEQTLDRLGRLDILVNNAGITRDAMFHKMDSKQWVDVFSVNMMGPFYCTRAAIPFMRMQASGRIVNIASIVGITGNVGQANYAASKAALIGFTKSLARENASKGITVNAIAPGFIETEMLEAVPDDIRRTILSDIPLRRFGKPGDVADGVAYLVSEAGSYITGQVLSINGGLCME
jgi:3-oxoacyl-[acyl-carrier protein] reductase